MSDAFFRLKFSCLCSAVLAAQAASSAVVAAPPQPPATSFVLDAAVPPADPVQVTGTKYFSPMIVGQNNPGQSAAISGTVFAKSSLVMGQNAGSTGNALLIAGDGAALVTLDYVNPTLIGDAGAGNTFTVGAGGSFSLNQATIGNLLGADSNQLVIESSVPSFASLIFVGEQGSDNQLSVINGGQLVSIFAQLGTQAGASFNSVTVGADSFWSLDSSSGALVVGQAGDDNSVQVTDGGILSLSSTVAEADQPAPDITVGGTGGDRNSLFIGYGSAASHPGDIVIGESGSDNQLSLYFSGTLASGGNAYVGGGPGYYSSLLSVPRESADGNVAVVDGLATSWSVGGALYVGAGGAPSSSANQLSVQYGGRVSAVGGLFIGQDAGSNGNLVSVFGVDADDVPNPSLLETADIRIGLTGDDVEANVSTGNMLIAGSTDPGNYSGTVNAQRILVANGNSLGLGGGAVFSVGDVSFGSTSGYQVTVNSTSRGSLTASGTASLGGTVGMNFGDQFDNRFVILTGSVVDGAFSLDTSNLSPGLSASLETITGDSGTEVAIGFVSAFAQNPNLDANDLAVATSIDDAFNSGSSIPGELATAPPPAPAASVAAAPVALAAAPMTVAAAPVFPEVDREALRERLSALAGEVGAGGGTLVAQQAGRAFLSLLAGSDGSGRGAVTGTAAAGPALWGSVYGTMSSVEGQASTGSHDADTSVWGIASGIESRLSGGQTIGLAVSGGGAGWDLADGQGSGESDFVQLGAYGQQDAGAFYLSLAGSLAWHAMSTERDFAVLRRHAYDATFNATGAAMRAEAGYRLAAQPGAVLTPYAALEGQYLATGSYDEHTSSGNGAFALSYDESSDSLLRSEAGVQIDLTSPAEQPLFALWGRAAWVHDWHWSDGGTASFQAIDGTGFNVTSAEPPADLLLLGLGLGARAGDRMDVSASVNGEWGKGYESVTAAASLRYEL